MVVVGAVEGVGGEQGRVSRLRGGSGKTLDMEMNPARKEGEMWGEVGG